MTSLKLIISYDGTHYLGWQKTKEGPSIEEILEATLSKILQHPVSLEAASRTDAGVHAKGQVVKVTTSKTSIDLGKLQVSLNQLLPSDIAARDLSFAPEAFHPTLDAQSKTYSYLVTTAKYLCPFKRHTYWHVPKKLDVKLMEQAAKSLVGYHDFKAFTNDREPPYINTHREVYTITIQSTGDDICFLIEGNNFLYKMVRNIVGTLVYVGQGKLKPEDIDTILHDRQRPKAGMTAPAQGLSLLSIHYDPLKSPMHAHNAPTDDFLFNTLLFLATF